MNILNTLTNKLTDFLLYGINGGVSNLQMVEKAIDNWKNSPQRIMQIKGHLYYTGEHDIKKRKRTMIGEDGKLQIVDNLPNNRQIDNQFAKLVNQKANYLFGQPVTIDAENNIYADAIKEILDEKFMKILKKLGKEVYKCGIGWLMPLYDENGVFTCKTFPSYEILPFWGDSDHTKLQGAVRLYNIVDYEGTVGKIVEKVEIFDENGVHCYILEGCKLVPDLSMEQNSYAYVTVVDGDCVKGANWNKIPLIPFKRNDDEISVLKNIKTLQDGLNVMLSDFQNNMQEDTRNTILVLKNYDGTNLGEFRKNLSTYGAIKVRYDGDAKGGVETLEIKVDADNYKTILDIFKKAITENAMAYDAKDDRLGGNANQMNIQSMYSDIDLDANDTETEFKASLKELLWFVNCHLKNIGVGDFFDEKVNLIFNRDIMMNEAEIINNCRNSVGILSDETIINNHPWVDDPALELKRIREQKEKEEAHYDPFGTRTQRGDGANNDPGNKGDTVDE